MRLDEAALDDYTDRFARSAWRYETRDSYQVASDADGFQRYLAGRDPEPGFGVGWRTWLANRRAENRYVRRVRVLSREPSPYLRFEFEWAYLPNLDAGEEIRILDLTERPRPAGLVDDELWLLDRSRAAIMTYDERGAFLHADTVEGSPAQPLVRAVDAAWAAGEEFATWWERHPEYHRVVGLDRSGAGD